MTVSEQVQQPSTSLTDLLTTLTSSLESAQSAQPSDIFSSSSDATKNGISLLTTKNELLLSYLHNLVFLIVLKLRSFQNSNDTDDDESKIGTDVVSKLVELRAYMDKGVKPLEGKLKYQIEKVVRAADDAERDAFSKQTRKANGAKSKMSGSKVRRNGAGNGSNESSDNSSSGASSEDGESESDGHELDDLSYRPNPSALQLKSKDTTTSSTRPSKTLASTAGAYKPPRINPTAMPTSVSDQTSRKATRDRPNRSNLMDDYVAEELDVAPHAQPSIGSNIADHGRTQVSQRDRAEQANRTRYEEENFIRLPTLSKAEKKKQKARAGGRGDMYGGEEFRGLGEIGDRVSRAVGRKERGGGSGSDALGKSRKRGVGDLGGGGEDLRMGGAFEKRRRVLEDRKARKMK